MRVPRALADRLRFVRLLDGRPVTEWTRAVLAEAVARLLLTAPGFAWARAAAPWWRDTVPVTGAPSGALVGGERVLVLAVEPEAFGVDLDPEGDGLGLLVDVVGEDGGRTLRRVLVRAVDVLPWRRRPGEPIPAGSPGARAAERAGRRHVGRPLDGDSTAV